MQGQGFNLTKEQRAGTWGYNAYGEDCRVPWVQWSLNEKCSFMLCGFIVAATFVVAGFLVWLAWQVLILVIAGFFKYLWPGVKRALKQQVWFVNKVVHWGVGFPVSMICGLTNGFKAPDQNHKVFDTYCWTALLLLAPGVLSSHWNFLWAMPLIWILWLDLSKKHPMP